MNWPRRLAVAFGIYLALLLLQGLAARTTFALLRLPLGIVSHLSAPVVDLLHYPRLRADNDALHRTVAALTQQHLEVETLRAENARLRALVALRDSQPQRRVVVARVIARDPTQWTRSVTINRGQRDGLSLGLPVVSATGVVGKIAEVHPSTSLVLLVSDPEVRVGAVVSRTRDQGLAVGGGGWEVRVLYLPVTSETAAGDDVVTSGVGGVFPAGLPLGRVASVALDASRLYRVAVIEPSAALGRLEDVGCLVAP